MSLRGASGESCKVVQIAFATPMEFGAPKGLARLFGALEDALPTHWLEKDGPADRTFSLGDVTRIVPLTGGWSAFERKSSPLPWEGQLRAVEAPGLSSFSMRVRIASDEDFERSYHLAARIARAIGPEVGVFHPILLPVDPDYELGRYGAERFAERGLSAFSVANWFAGSTRNRYDTDFTDLGKPGILGNRGVYVTEDPTLDHQLMYHTAVDERPWALDPSEARARAKLMTEYLQRYGLIPTLVERNPLKLEPSSQWKPLPTAPEENRPSVDELLRAVIAKTAPPPPGVFRWMVDGHGFSESYAIEVETNGKIRGRALDAGGVGAVEWESSVSSDDLALLASAIRESGFPHIELPDDYEPRPDIGQLTVSVSPGRWGQLVTLPQDSGSVPMSEIADAFSTLKSRAGH